jgi:hypothetical protein
MTLQDFKIVKNKQRPDFCYSYEKKTDTQKHSIFTMDGGHTYLASIEELRQDGRWYSELSEKFNTIGECINAFNENREI